MPIFVFFVALSVSFSMTMRTSDCKKKWERNRRKSKSNSSRKKLHKKSNQNPKQQISDIISGLIFTHQSRVCFFLLLFVFVSSPHFLTGWGAVIIILQHTFFCSIALIRTLLCLQLTPFQLSAVCFFVAYKCPGSLSICKKCIYILLSARGTQRVVIIRHLWEEEKKWIVKRNTSKWNEPFWNVIFETFCLHI